jgi:hypothetical protein
MSIDGPAGAGTLGALIDRTVQTSVVMLLVATSALLYLTECRIRC